MPTINDDLRKRQRNTLPSDVIANDRHVNDVFWNGTRDKSRIQRAGAMVVGGTLLLGGIGAAVIAYQRGAWIGIFTTAAIAIGGGRVLYRTLVPSNQPRRIR
ncbi:hypothetical protein HDF16_002824 [Granulicella aggregans]|uniref:Uncharacterized protein n=1 Tax=Granulicella aggregans TaxID=474949 RepID=A0A7W7ZDZ4_9BACT|nr:hypothetical protein [Granulicella aggregans]